MSALLDSLAAGFHGDASRRALLDEALRDGLPGARSEAWKYTPLRALERRTFAPARIAPAIDPAALAHIPAPRLVFVNGQHVQGLSDLAGLDAGVSVQPLSGALAGDDTALRFLTRRFERQDEVFARLNAALAGEGALLRVDAGVQSTTPVQLVFVSAPAGGSGEAGGDEAWHLRHVVEVREGAALAIAEHHLGVGDSAHLGNTLAHVQVGAGARLTHARVQREGDRSTTFLRTDAVLGAGADYRRVDLELGGALSRHELNVRLEGRDARLTANGVLLAAGRTHLDTRLGIDHAALDTASQLVWRGLGAGRGKAVFHGGILIREGADGTDANLSNKNLLLSADAEIDSQPVLEIHADEVKAAHGATVGQLDPQSVFYLRSRGLPEADARRLLTAAFCREPLAVVDDLALRALLVAAVDDVLAARELA